MSATINELVDQIMQKKLQTLDDYLKFGSDFLQVISFQNGTAKKLQATIVSQSDSRYCFFQFGEEQRFAVTRPINRTLFLGAKQFEKASDLFLKTIQNPKAAVSNKRKRENINKIVYTCQQAIGCTLDSLNNANSARKMNGDCFESFIRVIVRACGIDVVESDKTASLGANEKIKFERDIVLCKDGIEKALGQIKTSTKDRLSKIFLDKRLYNSTVADIPYFAVILNDVQRAKTRQPGTYKTASTFLPGHFKAFTVALCPLDGVYYIDLRDNMKNDVDLKKHISCFDQFLVEDMWRFIQ